MHFFLSQYSLTMDDGEGGKNIGATTGKVKHGHGSGFFRILRTLRRLVSALVRWGWTVPVQVQFEPEGMVTRARYSAFQKRKKKVNRIKDRSSHNTIGHQSSVEKVETILDTEVH